MKVRFRFEDDIAEILSRITIKSQATPRLIVIQDAFPKAGQEAFPKVIPDAFPRAAAEAFPVERAEVLMEGFA